MTDLAEILGRVRPGDRATPPTVDHLRQVLDHRRRRRQRVALGGVGALLAGWAGVAAFVGASPPAVVETLPAAPAPAVAAPSSATEAATPEWSILLPSESWRPVMLSSSPHGVDVGSVYQLWITGSDDGPLGPVAAAVYNRGIVDADAYLDGPVVYEDVPAAGGTVVRVGLDDGPELLDAIVPVDGGSVAVQTAGLDRDTVVELAAALRVESDALSVAADALPAGLRVAQAPVARPGYRSELVLERPDGPALRVETTPADWASILMARVDAGPGSSAPLVGQPGQAWITDTDDLPTAVVISDDEVYRISEAPSESVEPVDHADLEQAVASLDRWTATDLMDELQLQPRGTLVAGWLDEAPLPAGHDLAWLADGPPIDPTSTTESALIHRWMACAWVDQWVETGASEALDAVTSLAGTQSVQTTDQMRSVPAARVDGADQVSGQPATLLELAASSSRLTSRTQRESSPLRQGCVESLGAN